ncbi:MAG TPA: integrase arm-type DNA-binding domain-containing protein [Burkholderiaceae bacterium]|nr:integrase arm-type DNA-binding domain-containing protein [Burkholderiaceae bacterium]
MLTDADCRNATCPSDAKRRRLTDSGGLYLEVSPKGSKRWFWKFYPNGKESRLALGSYPEVSLKAARAAREDAKKTKASGTNPVQQRKADKIASAASSAITYEAVAREFHGVKASGWSEGHATKWIRMNELYLFPQIGSLALDSIKAHVLLVAVRKVEAKGILSTAQDLLAMAGQVFRYGVQSGRCERNPATDLRGALKPHVAKHFAAITDPVEAGSLLRAIDGYTGQPTTRAALILASLFFQRPGNIHGMEWAWVDLEARMLTIPAESMKLSKHDKLNGKPHLVPLARQAVAVLKALEPLTGHGRYVFPGARTGERPMSDNTINAALRRLDYGTDDHVAHGFRAMARTMMAERLNGIDPDVVEAQLGHGKRGPLGSAYDRAEYMAQRRQIMQTWADYLDQLRATATVHPLKAA